MPSPADLVSRLLGRLVADGRLASDLGGTRAQIELQISDETGPATFHLLIRPGSLEALAGPSATPDIILRGHVADWTDLASGDVNLESALLDGRIQISGDLVAAISIAPVLVEAVLRALKS